MTDMDNTVMGMTEIELRAVLLGIGHHHPEIAGEAITGVLSLTRPDEASSMGT